MKNQQLTKAQQKELAKFAKKLDKWCGKMLKATNSCCDKMDSICRDIEDRALELDAMVNRFEE